MLNVHQTKDKGFTLIELLVSVSIFAVVVTLGLSLFNQVLKIQRRTEALRRANQAVRSATEFIVKEIRNGRIDYGIQDGTSLKATYPAQCPLPVLGGSTYVWNNPNGNKGIALVNPAGEQECVYYSTADKAIYLEKVGLATVQRLTPPDVTINRFEVRVVPGKDPFTSAGGLTEIQPMAQILIDATATLSATETKNITYQTAVSTNVYDIPRE